MLDHAKHFGGEDASGEPAVSDRQKLPAHFSGNGRRPRTCVVPLRSMRKRLMVQLPEATACSKPSVMMDRSMCLTQSKCSVLRVCLDSALVACLRRSLFMRLNRSSNSSASSPPASSSRLLP